VPATESKDGETQRAVKPASIGMTAPVMRVVASEASQRTASSHVPCVDERPQRVMGQRQHLVVLCAGPDHFGDAGQHRRVEVRFVAD